MATQEENRVGVGRESMIDGSLEWEWVVDVEKMLAEDNPHSRSIEEKQLEKQSIYLVPEWLKRTDIKAYQPQLVSLGPFHYGDSNLEPMEVHKRRALVHLIKQSKKPLQDFIHAINEVAGELEAAYGKDLDESWREDRRRFVDVMLMDGCFLLEIMSKKFQDYEPHDPIFSRHGGIGIFPLIRSDMLLIENQLPLLVLKKILGVLPPDYLVSFRCTHSLRKWSMLQRPEYQPLFRAVCTRLEQVATEGFFSNMGGSITFESIHHLLRHRHSVGL